MAANICAKISKNGTNPKPDSPRPHNRPPVTPFLFEETDRRKAPDVIAIYIRHRRADKSTADTLSYIMRAS